MLFCDNITFYGLNMDYKIAYNSRKHKCEYCRKKHVQDSAIHNSEYTESCFEDELSLEEFISVQLEQEALSKFEQSPYGRQLQKQCKTLLYNYYAAMHNYRVECEKHVEQYKQMKLKEISP